MPLARTTRRTWLSVAPVDSSIPIERSRRWASTVNPPTETSAISSMPRASATSEIVSGLIGFDCATEAGVCTSFPIDGNAASGASKSSVTPVASCSCPVGTRANSSSRLWGFSTMPTTVRSTPLTRQLLPTRRWKSDATPLVTATWSVADGYRPESSDSMGPVNGPWGLSARSW